MFTNFHKNIMGTVSFDLKLPKWRKPQGFIVYPMSEATKKVYLQSSKRWIELDLETGAAEMTNGKGGHPNSWLLMLQKSRGLHETFTVSAVDLQALKMHIFTTAGASVGSSFVLSDNSGAFNII